MGILCIELDPEIKASRPVSIEIHSNPCTDIDNNVPNSAMLCTPPYVPITFRFWGGGTENHG